MPDAKTGFPRLRLVKNACFKGGGHSLGQPLREDRIPVVEDIIQIKALGGSQFFPVQGSLSKPPSQRNAQGARPKSLVIIIGEADPRIALGAILIVFGFYSDTPMQDFERNVGVQVLGDRSSFQPYPLRPEARDRRKGKVHSGIGWVPVIRI